MRLRDTACARRESGSNQQVSDDAFHVGLSCEATWVCRTGPMYALVAKWTATRCYGLQASSKSSEGAGKIARALRAVTVSRLQPRPTGFGGRRTRAGSRLVAQACRLMRQHA